MTEPLDPNALLALARKARERAESYIVDQIDADDALRDGREHVHALAAGVEALVAELDEAAIRWRSLLTELWEGVRAHGLIAPGEGA